MSDKILNDKLTLLNEIYIKSNREEYCVNVEKQLIPLNKQILVRSLKLIRKNEKANLILSSSHMSDAKYCIGEVLNIAHDINGVKIGDIVLYKKGWAPIDFELDGAKYSFVKYEDISAKVLK